MIDYSVIVPDKPKTIDKECKIVTNDYSKVDYETKMYCINRKAKAALGIVDTDRKSRFLTVEERSRLDRIELLLMDIKEESM